MLMDLAKKALASPAVFVTYQSIVGAPECHRRFIHEMVKPVPGERVLDIGCGVGASLRYMPASVDYVGVDVSEPYIVRAKAQSRLKGKFICADIATLDGGMLGMFDRAFCFGVLHHFSDAMVAHAVKFVRRVVKPGGVFVSIDPCYVPGQNLIAKLINDHDRGAYIRDPAGFERIVSSLGHVHAKIYNNLLRIPYTQIVMRVVIGGESTPG
jgi:SAM-dependent methyltransferase